jgi:multidrug efflux system membrane fusion protein
MPDESVTGETSSPEHESPKRPRRRRFLISAAVLLAFAGVFWLAFRRRSGRQGKPGAPSAPVAIATATALQRDLPVYLDAIGTVTPVYTASITSQVTGRVESVHYNEGQLVRKGTPLVDIDPRPLAATLMQAEGTLERDQHVLAQARMDLERYRAAWAKRAIAKQLYDDQEKLVLQAEGTVKVDRGVVEYDRVQLDYCHITAPIAGRVGLRLVDPGNVVTANGGVVLVVVTQLQPISVVFALSEDVLDEILAQPSHGESLPVEVFDRVRSRRLATGKLITIDNQIDTTTGTVRLRALFDNRDESLFPNQFVNTKLLVRTVSDATVLPSSAVQRNGEVTFVYLVEDSHVRTQRVTTGVIDGESTQISGLARGAVVANSSFEKLRDGAPVVISASPLSPQAREPPGSPRR